MKILKIALLSIIGIVVLIIIIMVWSLNTPQFSKSELKKVFAEKTDFILTQDFQINSYKNSGLFSVHGDFAEEYNLKIDSSDYLKFLKSLQLNNPQNWKILENGYQLVLSSKSMNDTEFIFFLDRRRNEINIQINQ